VLLELRFRPESLEEGTEVFRRELVATRAFDGNVTTEVLVDEEDPTHWVIHEIWESVEADEAYPQLPRRGGQDHRPSSAAGRAVGQDQVHHVRRLSRFPNPAPSLTA